MMHVVCADMQQQQLQQSRPKVHKKRQTKLDKDGHRPEVSVYAKAYNKVKAQFSRIRYQHCCCYQSHGSTHVAAF